MKENSGVGAVNQPQQQGSRPPLPAERRTHDIAVVGSDNFGRMNAVLQLVRHLHNTKNNLHLISGGRQGVDTTALTEAQNLGIPFTVHNHTSDYIGGQPTITRDVDSIIEECDGIYIFWNAESQPERRLIEKVVKKGVDHEILLESQNQWGAAMETVKEAERTVVVDDSIVNSDNSDDDDPYLKKGLADGRDFEDLV